MRPVILFVDDDLDVREAIADLLEFAGWTVAHADDGEQALVWLAENPLPAAILLDLKMPRCDGYEFRRRQLADPRLKVIPTAVFTADANVDVNAMPSLGHVPVLRKSIELPELSAVLERMTRRKG